MSSYDQYIKPRYIKSGPELDNVITIGGKAIPGVDGLEWTIADPLTVETQELIAEGVKFYLDGVDVSKDVTDFVACLERDAWQIFLRLGPYEQEEGHGEVLVLDGQGNVLYDYDC